ncbi:hypothetical protein CCR95_03515 [Thiocystis minor]|uniref:PAS domain-containing protein n=1 Tax=Thiocystis minor TaxID=61597 RepID=UPI001A932825|nr:PAS domain-containing protein [Thiocystis minor]MBK5963180.1 hypothetical protein [Thiocystis minor]
MNTDAALRLLGESPDALIATDAQGRVIYWSQGAETVFGYPRAEAVGQALNALAQWLKAHPRLRQIPLVAVTALAMVGDRERVLAAGFYGYLAKPIAPRAFVGQVEAFLPWRRWRRCWDGRKPCCSCEPPRTF